ncbi:hypothetical protein HanPI659440_Chr08g0280641 [Helianthus annuus]|nr:hypothetical protein HanPI659440_Chr08g0280641 [Helianthus annuus]
MRLLLERGANVSKRTRRNERFGLRSKLGNRKEASILAIKESCNEAREESRSHVKGKDAGSLLVNAYAW